MITTVTLNAAIDKTYYADRFAIGGVYRVRRTINEPGGKGNNVAKVVRLLGGDVCASGFAGGANGAFIRRALEEQGIPTKFVEIGQESRICLNVIRGEDGVSTELLEAGPTLSDEQVAEMKAVVSELARRSRIVVLSGSVPAGVSPGIYAELIPAIRDAGALAFLDTSGPALSAGVAVRPDFVKPNEDEIRQLAGGDVADEAAAAIRLAEAGIPRVCLSLGERGTLAVLDGAVYRAIPPRIDAVNTVGCGDAFVGGMAYAISRGLPPEEALRTATAAAAANALSERAGSFDPETYERLLPLAKVERLG